MPAMDQSALETIKKVEGLVGGFQSSLETTSGEVQNLQKNITEQAKLLKQVQDKHDEFQKGTINNDEYKRFAEKIGTEILELSQKIEKVAKTAQVAAKQMPFRTWRYDAKNLITVYDDDARPLSDLQQRAFRLFEMPVKYEGVDGELLKHLRNLGDCLAIIDTTMRVSGKRFDITQSKTFKLYRELLDIVDPEFAKAMYSTGTGLGDEWVPTNMSSEMYDLYRLESGIETLIPHFDMPSNPYTWPIKTSNPTLYRAGEAATNNPNTVVKSNLGTSNITFTAETFAAALLVSPQMIEDSIVAMVPAIREGLAIAGVDGYESLLINGDNSTTHIDNSVVTDHYTATSPETYEKGFRKMAADLSTTFDAASTTTGVGDATAAFVPKDLRYMRQLMSPLSIRRPEDCVYVVSPSGYFQILNAVEATQPGTYGGTGSWITGGLQSIDGCQLIVSSKISEDLTAAGIYDASDTGYTVAFCFHKPSFKIGEKRGMTVEAQKNIDTQQLLYVMSMRKSFQKMTASTLKPVALGYKILD
uniref:Putative capsid protein n=1 Tax=viral metagenome TaxID=1070528 RepID=A0A6M3JX07_9ZZZZ